MGLEHKERESRVCEEPAVGSYLMGSRNKEGQSGNHLLKLEWEEQEGRLEPDYAHRTLGSAILENSGSPC